MEHDCLKPAKLPRLSRLYSAFISNPKKLSEFYAHQPSLAGIREAARELKKGRARYADEMRSAVVEILRDENTNFAGGVLPVAVSDNLALLSGGAVAIVTGQQVGLFGGPAYTFYKALSVLRVAAQLENGGIPSVPVFWMASEDHDLAEVNHVNWAGQSGLERLEWTGNSGQESLSSVEGSSVGHISLGPGITELVRRAIESLGGPAANDIGQILADAYQPGATFGTAFAKLMMAMFGDHGLIVLDPLDSRFHRLAAPLMQRAHDESTQLTAALLEQNKRLEGAGYHTQVKVTDRSTLLFATVDGKRVALRARNGGFAGGNQEFTSSELRAAIEVHPENFSPNALLRPIVQDTLLPTAAYIGGPAEIAYFAQNRVLYDRLLMRAPAILPRASFTVVEQVVGRLLKKYALTIADVFHGRQHLRSMMERRNIPLGFAKRLAADEKELVTLLESLRRPIEKLDPTLAGALDTAKRKILYQFNNLSRKSGRAIDFRTGVLSRHENTILDSLFPLHDLQERSASLLPLIARNGLALLDQLEKNAGLGAAVHRIVRL